MSEADARGTASVAAEPITFEITTTSSLLERQPRTLKHGHTFGLFDPYGDIKPGPDSPEGLFHDDTRYLSSLQLLVEGRRPLLLSSTVQDNNALLTVHLTAPDVFSGSDLRLMKDTVHILRSKFVWRGHCFERLRVQNFDDQPHRLAVEFAFSADFADLFEVRGQRRPRRGRLWPDVEDGQSVTFHYEALDGQRYRTGLHFDPPPLRLEAGRAVYELLLDPGEQRGIFIVCRCGTGDRLEPAKTRFLPCYRQARRELRAATSRAASVKTSNEVFNEVLCRSVADLYMLMTDTEAGPYPYAGVPWYSTVFGRDGIITALQMLWLDPEIARGVLRFLASRQARDLDPRSDAEPGKILHEMRLGEMARLGEVPFGLYYGSADATPLFVVLAGLYYERTGDLETIGELWPSLEAALGWIDRYGDSNGDGFFDYARKDAAGLFNQGWKDSHDAIFHSDGRMAEPPIALCEIQGYVYAAKRHGARLARDLGLAVKAVELDREAELLREAVEKRFWSEELGFYVLALDGRGEACRVRASNAGHLLFCGLPAVERATRVADTLFGTGFFSGWGIRTLAASEARYNPISYHNGSVWPHDNALIALGLARYGLTGHLLQLFKGLFDAASYLDQRRLPELFCGFRRQPGAGPTVYPVACAPQAWASATPFALLEACLGLRFDAKSREVRFHRPSLPRFLDELSIRSLRLGDASVDVLLRRHDSDVSVNVLRREGDLVVRVTLS